MCAADAGDLDGARRGEPRPAPTGDVSRCSRPCASSPHERLVDGGEARPVRRRHAEHCLALAERARPFARGPRESEWLDRLTLELDNLRAALGFAIETGDAALGLTLAEALEPLWIRGMRQREACAGSSRCCASRARSTSRARRRARARRALGDRDRRSRARRAVAARGPRARARAGDDRRTAWALHGLGHLRAEQGDSTRARALFEESLELFLRWATMPRPAGG